MNNASFVKIERTIGAYKLHFKFGYTSVEYVPADDALKALKRVGKNKHPVVAARLFQWLCSNNSIITAEEMGKKYVHSFDAAAKTALIARNSDAMRKYNGAPAMMKYVITAMKKRTR